MRAHIFKRFLLTVLLFLWGCDGGAPAVPSRRERLEETKVPANQAVPDSQKSRKGGKMSDPAAVGFMAGFAGERVATESIPDHKTSGPSGGEKKEGPREDSAAPVIDEEESADSPVMILGEAPPAGEEDIPARFATVEEMIRREDPLAKETLLKILADRDPQIQVAAVTWLGKWIEREPEIREKLDRFQ